MSFSHENFYSSGFIPSDTDEQTNIALKLHENLTTSYKIIQSHKKFWNTFENS